eukprot:802373-Amphidinium_carterae.1
MVQCHFGQTAGSLLVPTPEQEAFLIVRSGLGYKDDPLCDWGSKTQLNPEGRPPVYDTVLDCPRDGQGNRTYCLACGNPIPRACWLALTPHGGRPSQQNFVSSTKTITEKKYVKKKNSNRE